ncbi:MAG: hypothetical protein H7A23_02915 [Leptospiraceae bacterium]|nr:hypothetical protein [Leptospiraceae bacterium]
MATKTKSDVGYPRKSDGNRDMRYTSKQVLNYDGSRDMRYNSETAATLPKETKAYIYTSSSERHQYMEKRGSSEEAKDAAHKLSHRVLETALNLQVGRPLQDEAVIQAMNSQEQLRIKSDVGNRILDERRDKRIAEAISNGEGVAEKTTFKRAAQAYDGAVAVADKYEEIAGKRSAQLDNVVEILGDLELQNGTVGRPMKVKNFPKGESL